MPSFKNKVRVKAEAINQTADALLVKIDGQKYWIPQSQIDDDSEVYDADVNSEGDLVISEWIATQKGIEP